MAITLNGVIPGGHRGAWSRWGLATSTASPAQTAMTGTGMDLSEPLARHGQGDFPRTIAGASLRPIVEADVEGPIAQAATNAAATARPGATGIEGALPTPVRAR